MTSFSRIDGLRFRRKVRAVVTSPTNQFLLIRPHGYAADCWTLPGGGVEADETAVQAICRELQEELGLSASIACQSDRLNIRSTFIYNEKYKAKRNLDHDGQVAELFHCSLPHKTTITRQIEEIQEIAWFEVAEAIAAFKVPSQREIFQQCLLELECKLMKRQVA